MLFLGGLWKPIETTNNFHPFLHLVKISLIKMKSISIQLCAENMYNLFNQMIPDAINTTHSWFDHNSLTLINNWLECLMDCHFFRCFDDIDIDTLIVLNFPLLFMMLIVLHMNRGFFMIIHGRFEVLPFPDTLGSLLTGFG